METSNRLETIREAADRIGGILREPLPEMETPDFLAAREE